MLSDLEKNLEKNKLKIIISFPTMQKMVCSHHQHWTQSRTLAMSVASKKFTAIIWTTTALFFLLLVIGNEQSSSASGFVLQELPLYSAVANERYFMSLRNNAGTSEQALKAREQQMTPEEKGKSDELKVLAVPRRGKYRRRRTIESEEPVNTVNIDDENNSEQRNAKSVQAVQFPFSPIINVRPTRRFDDFHRFNYLHAVRHQKPRRSRQLVGN